MTGPVSGAVRIQVTGRSPLVTRVATLIEYALTSDDCLNLRDALGIAVTALDDGPGDSRGLKPGQSRWLMTASAETVREIAAGGGS